MSKCSSVRYCCTSGGICVQHASMPSGSLQQDLIQLRTIKLYYKVFTKHTSEAWIPIQHRPRPMLYWNAVAFPPVITLKHSQLYEFPIFIMSQFTTGNNDHFLWLQKMTTYPTMLYTTGNQSAYTARSVVSGNATECGSLLTKCITNHRLRQHVNWSSCRYCCFEFSIDVKECKHFQPKLNITLAVMHDDKKHADALHKTELSRGVSDSNINRCNVM